MQNYACGVLGFTDERKEAIYSILYFLSFSILYFLSLSLSLFLSFFLSFILSFSPYERKPLTLTHSLRSGAMLMPKSKS